MVFENDCSGIVLFGYSVPIIVSLTTTSSWSSSMVSLVFFVFSSYSLCITFDVLDDVFLRISFKISVLFPLVLHAHTHTHNMHTYRYMVQRIILQYSIYYYYYIVTAHKQCLAINWENSSSSTHRHTYIYIYFISKSARDLDFCFRFVFSSWVFVCWKCYRVDSFLCLRLNFTSFIQIIYVHILARTIAWHGISIREKYIVYKYICSTKIKYVWRNN